MMSILTGAIIALQSGLKALKSVFRERQTGRKQYFDA